MEKVPVKVKIGWGFGGVADNFIMQALNTLVHPIYNIGLGIDPLKLGMALFIPRAFDAFTDPLMGNISDNTRSRYGRRKPYIVAGALASGMILPLLWMPPSANQNAILIYFTIVAVLYAFAYTIFVVPYTALGFELTTDYDERTRTLAWRMYLGLVSGLASPWIYKLCLLPVFNEDALLGVKYVSIGLGAIIIITGVLPALVGREETFAQQQKKIQLSKALKITFRNKPFVLLMVSFLIILTGLFTSWTFNLYINIYYVCQGNKSFAATLSGWVGTIVAITSYLSLFLISAVSMKFGKKFALMFGQALAFIGLISMWFTMTPKMPYLQLISAFVFGLGPQGCWLMISSMTADICDEDELNTGLRREGVYGAVSGFVQKISFATTALTGGLLLKFSGYDALSAEAGELIDSAVTFKMRLIYVSVQSTALLIAFILCLFYPITRDRSEQTRKILDQRHIAEDYKEKPPGKHVN